MRLTPSQLLSAPMDLLERLTVDVLWEWIEDKTLKVGPITNECKLHVFRLQ